MAASPQRASDSARFKELVSEGMVAMRDDDIDGLRQVVGQLWQNQVATASDTELLNIANILVG